MERVAGAGLKMAVLRGVDPNSANHVIAGWLLSKGSPQPQSDAASVSIYFCPPRVV